LDRDADLPDGIEGDELDVPDELGATNDLDELHDERDEGGDTEHGGPRRRNGLPRRVESWRQRSASGAIATAIAMGLQQVFEPEQRRPAIVQEAPGDPYGEDDPVSVDYVPDDAEGTKVTIKPWLMKKGEDDA
jgi:hypothetical protein